MVELSTGTFGPGQIVGSWRRPREQSVRIWNEIEMRITHLACSLAVKDDYESEMVKIVLIIYLRTLETIYVPTSRTEVVMSRSVVDERLCFPSQQEHSKLSALEVKG